MKNSDFRQKPANDRNWLERIGHKIPGFRGYLEKEERRTTDKLLRDHIAQRLEQLRGDMDPLMRDLTNRGGFDMLKLVNELDRVKKAVERLRGRIQYASYGYSGMFDAVKVRENELDRLYQYDVQLLDLVDDLQEKFVVLTDPLKSAKELEGALRQVLQNCREFDRKIDDREQILQASPTNEQQKGDAQ